MTTTQFPRCCSCMVLYRLGGSESDPYATVEEIVDGLKMNIRRYRFSGLKLLVAMTNSRQRNANKALELVGFKNSGFSKHPQYGSRIKLWWYDLT